MQRTNPHIEKAAHCAYCLRYHIVMATKYRHKVLMEPYLHAVSVGIQSGAEASEVKLERYAVQPDHIHLLIAAQPTTYIPDLIAAIKRHIGYQMSRAGWAYGQPLSRSYYIASVGGYDKSDAIERYIAAQHNRV